MIVLYICYYVSTLHVSSYVRALEKRMEIMNEENAKKEDVNIVDLEEYLKNIPTEEIEEEIMRREKLKKVVAPFE